MYLTVVVGCHKFKTITVYYFIALKLFDKLYNDFKLLLFKTFKCMIYAWSLLHTFSSVKRIFCVQINYVLTSVLQCKTKYNMFKLI